MEKSDLVGDCCEELMKKMKMGKKRGGLALNPGLGLGSGVVRLTRSMSGKRIAISSNVESLDSPAIKRQCTEKLSPVADKSMIEALPQDVLVKILCGVDHDDLKQLFHVSKPIREATLIARHWFFAYNTPRKTGLTMMSDDSDVEEIDAPNAPKQEWTHRPRLSGKRLAGITVALFA